MPGRLDGKIAIITGSGRGIGRASALRFAAEGAAVVVADVDDENAQATADAIVADGGRATAQRTDVTVSAQVDALVEATVSRWGRLDVMFNNAGGALPRPTEEVDDDDLRRVLALNLDGVFHGARAALGVMKEQRGGCILITASGAGLGAVPGLAAYGMAKAAVINLAKSICAEFGPFGIRANVISPGPILSEGFSAYLDSVPGLRDHMQSGVPLRRLGLPEDIANAALFLASDEASFVSGLVVPVDGGIASQYPTPTPEGLGG